MEERNNIRSNIRAAYKRKTVTFEELLEVLYGYSMTPHLRIRNIDTICATVLYMPLYYICHCIIYNATVSTQTCAAIEEELVFLSAPSRLDYFKAGIQVCVAGSGLSDALMTSPVDITTV